MKRLALSVFWMLLTLNSLPSLFAQESDWPRTVPLKQGTVTIYAPQVDAYDDNSIQFRAALAYRATPGSEPVFGAGWFESPVVIDTSKRIVHPSSLTVTETRFPENTDDIRAELSMVVALQSPRWNLGFPMDELDASLATAASEAKAVNTTPPTIFYRDHPALLISIDGEPVLREIEDSPLKAVINTPYPLIFDGRNYYLNAAKDVWYRAGKATGPYAYTSNPPATIAAMVKPDEATAEADQPAAAVTAANAPEIVVSTEPAELIVTEGPAAFVPLVDDLLVLQNSDNDVFMHVTSQEFYIVLAGRWYRSASLNGPWAFQAADKLPPAFADIPRDSSQADSRVYVAGTEEARDAVLDAQVPQTAAVQRGVVDIDVSYDGEPVYRPVDGTDLVYIRNTGSTVLVSGGLYYLVEDGVWYVSASASGPWQVSDHRPAQVDRILPTSPVYNTKYVYVYDSTPDVVYVGYTPGYLGSYVYRNTIFYGTGWYYRPWVSTYYYYPRFSTWGFNVAYDPWYGWSFGLGWAWGPFSAAYYPGGYWHHHHYWHQPHYGYWGPGRYRPRHDYHHHGRNRYAHNDYRRDRHDRYDGRYDDPRYDNSRDRGRDYRPRDGQQRHNLYRDTSQRARVASTRDKQMRVTDRYANNGARVQSYAGKTRPERNRTSPVTTTELRKKARVRDVNLEAKNTALLADSRGNVYSKPGRKTDTAARPGGNGKPGGVTRPASKQSQARVTEKRVVSRTAATGSNVVRQPQQATSRTKQRANSRASTPPQQVSSRKAPNTRPVSKTGRVSAAELNASARQPQQVTNRNVYRQQKARDVSAPSQTRAVSPRSPQPKNARVRVTQNPAPTQRVRAASQPAPAQNVRQQSSGKPSGKQGASRSSGSKVQKSDSGRSRKD